MGNRTSTAVFGDESQYEYQAPRPNDSRGPCPVLNILANHGYLPRDGKNIPPEVLQLALQEKMGMTWLSAKIVMHVAYKTVGKNGLLSLSDLSYHAPDSLEHDSSLSRLDAAVSDNQQSKFDQQRFNTFLSFSKDGKFLTTDDVAAARVHFLADSKANNPHFLWNDSLETKTWVETAGLLHILGEDGKISVEEAKLFFEEETFPTGWQKHAPFGVLELYSSVKALKNAAHEHEKQQRIQHENV